MDTVLSFNFKFNFKSSTKNYKDGTFNESLIRVLEKYDENDIVINKMDFMKILLKYKVVNNFGNINDWLKSTFGNIISE